MNFPDNSQYKMGIELVKNAVDVEHLLVTLGFDIKMRSTKELRAPCIIHGGDNKTAFRISRISKVWTCFSRHCEEKVGGKRQNDVIGLVMAVKNYDFKEAVRFLSTFTGVNIDGVVDLNAYAKYTTEKENRSFIETVKKLRRVNLPTVLNENFIKRAVTTRTDYFIKKGFNTEVLDFFKVGGLYYDESNIPREIIPVYDENNRLVGVQGRRIDSDDDPKYLTRGGFSKGRVLYNLNNAKNFLGDINPTLIVVEGVTDVWSLYGMEYLNAVSTFGTGVSEDQVSLLRKFALNVIILFDGDLAGKEAAERSYESISKGCNAYILSLPFVDGKKTDPVSVNKHWLNDQLMKAYRYLGVI